MIVPNELPHKEGWQSMAQGHFWFKGRTLPDGSTEEFGKDCTFALCDFTATRNKNCANFPYAYNITDINAISNILGIPWEPSKDVPFLAAPTFLVSPGTWSITQ
jgi:hypothetical protein